MTCKIAVLRKESGRLKVGDCVEVFDSNVYLGDAVEPVGGYYVVIDVNDCDKDHETIAKLTAHWEHPVYDRQHYLQPVTAGDPFFTELLTIGRINVSIADVEQYVRMRNG